MDSVHQFYSCVSYLLLQPCMGGVSDHIPLSELMLESSDSLVNELLEEGGFLLFFDLIGTTGGSTLVNQVPGAVDPIGKAVHTIHHTFQFFKLQIHILRNSVFIISHDPSPNFI